MGVPASEVGYTIATTRRETTNVHKNMWRHWGEGDHWFVCVGRDSSVGIATRYGLDGSEIESRWGARFTAHV